MTEPPEETANPVQTLEGTSIGLGMAAIIGVFTALGIQGDLFARMLRNAPRMATVAFAFALAGVVLGLIGTFLSRRRGRPQKVPLVLGVCRWARARS